MAALQSSSGVEVLHFGGLEVEVVQDGECSDSSFSIWHFNVGASWLVAIHHLSGFYQLQLPTCLSDPMFFVGFVRIFFDP